MIANCISKFESLYGGTAELIRVFFAPGRFNIIGEHIDYNGGPVMPAGIQLGVFICIRKNNSTSIQVYSEQHGASTFEINTSYHFEQKTSWVNYIKAVLQVLQLEGYQFGGAEIYIQSNLPEAAGLSSSAAFELALCNAFLDVFHPQHNVRKEQMALLCQKAENEFVGVQCGIMDQFASAMAKEKHAILLDCNTLQYSYIPMNIGDYSWVIINTHKARTLATSAFNVRKQECDTAFNQISKQYAVSYLCQAPIDSINRFKDNTLQKRVKHVLCETARVHAMVQAFENNNLIRVGQLLNESHISLCDDYEVSCIELDCITDAARTHSACLGARMTGAGFGGCAIALVYNDAYADFVHHVNQVYETTCGLKASFYIASISDGVKEVYL